MNRGNLIAVTPSQDVEYSFQSLTVATDMLTRYADVLTFNDCCKSGCKNYGLKWSCPPFAPEYSFYISKYSMITVCLLKVELYQFAYIKNDYLKIKAANSILKSRIDRTLRYLKNANCHYISTGSCRLCKPCKRKNNLPCAHPELMAYSFEALGIDVCRMSEELFNTELLWYSKNKLPQYTCVVAGLLSNEKIPEGQIYEILRINN